MNGAQDISPFRSEKVWKILNRSKGDQYWTGSNNYLLSTCVFVMRSCTVVGLKEFVFPDQWLEHWILICKNKVWVSSSLFVSNLNQITTNTKYFLSVDWNLGFTPGSVNDTLKVSEKLNIRAPFCNLGIFKMHKVALITSFVKHCCSLHSKS